jgi:hypothetical protein
VEALVSLEWQAQTSFWSLKRKWVGGAAGGDGSGGSGAEAVAMET